MRQKTRGVYLGGGGGIGLCHSVVEGDEARQLQFSRFRTFKVRGFLQIPLF